MSSSLKQFDRAVAQQEREEVYAHIDATLDVIELAALDPEDPRLWPDPVKQIKHLAATALSEELPGVPCEPETLSYHTRRDAQRLADRRAASIAAIPWYDQAIELLGNPDQYDLSASDDALQASPVVLQANSLARLIEQQDAIEADVLCGSLAETILYADMEAEIRRRHEADDPITDIFEFEQAFSLEHLQASLDLALSNEDDTQRHHQVREPLGVIACIAPWNFPILNVPWQAGQALLAGNTIVFKQSEEIILFSRLISELIADSDIPDGVFNVVFGDGKVGEILVQEPIDAILFTGSTRTGQRITELAAKRSTRVLTEMGGSAPGIVFEDADVPAIASTVYAARFENTGQYCDGLKRLIVHESKLEEVLTELKKINDHTKVGDALNEDTDIGPLVAKRQLDALEAQVKDAVDKGAMAVFGGKKPQGLEGAYYEPTVLTNVTFDMKVWKEEVFGPVLPIVTFKTEEEAIHLGNDTIYGLGAYVFTRDKDRYFRVAKQLQSGIIGHNNALYYSNVTPFGGYKASGNSRTIGSEGFHEVTQVKIISEEK